MFDDLNAAIGGLTNTGNTITQALVNAANNTRTIFDAANGVFKPVGGGVAPGGDSAGTDIQQTGGSSGFFTKVKPYLLPAVGVLALLGTIWFVVKHVGKPATVKA